MNNAEAPFLALITELNHAASDADVSWRARIYHGKTVVIDFVNNGNEYALDLNRDKGVLIGTVVGRTATSRRLLRNAMVGSYEMKRRDGERHVLGPVSHINSTTENVVAACFRKLKIINNLLDTQSLCNDESPIEHDAVNVFWWDAKANFGDAIGPWLVSAITNKVPVNGRGRNLLPAPLMSVGSILNLVEQDNTIVWGSGLIDRLSPTRIKHLRSINNVTIRAVRGRLTRSEVMEKVGWDVPEVYGDPALLLPRFLPILDSEFGANKISVVPHYVHIEYFKKLGSETVDIVDVQTGLESVVRQIATSKACISTSLHGLIIAQAYGVPWVWIRVNDEQLSGDTFKFEDFFSTLERADVSSIDVAKNGIADLDLYSVARQASLPALRISLDDLLDSFPQQALTRGAGARSKTRALRMELGESRIESPSFDDLFGAVTELAQRIESMGVDLAEQRRLLEELMTAPEHE